MFKFIQNLVPKDEPRVKNNQFLAFKSFCSTTVFNKFSVGKKRAEEKQEKTGLRTRLP